MMYAQALATMLAEAAELWSSRLAPPWPVVHPILYDARRS
jgi:hypothetical protein